MEYVFEEFVKLSFLKSRVGNAGLPTWQRRPKATRRPGSPAHTQSPILLNSECPKLVI